MITPVLAPARAILEHRTNRHNHCQVEVCNSPVTRTASAASMGTACRRVMANVALRFAANKKMKLSIPRAHSHVGRLFSEFGGNKIVTATGQYTAGVQMTKEPDSTANSKPGSKKERRAGVDATAKKPGARSNRVYSKFIQDSVVQRTLPQQQLTSINQLKTLWHAAASRASSEKPESVVDRLDQNSIKILAIGKQAQERAARVGEKKLNTLERHNLAAYNEYRTIIISRLSSVDHNALLALMDKRIIERYQKEIAPVPAEPTGAVLACKQAKKVADAGAPGETARARSQPNQGSGRSSESTGTPGAGKDTTCGGTERIRPSISRKIDNGENAKTSLWNAPKGPTSILGRDRQIETTSDHREAIRPPHHVSNSMTDASTGSSSEVADRRPNRVDSSGGQTVPSTAAVSGEDSQHRTHPEGIGLVGDGISTRDDARRQNAKQPDGSLHSELILSSQLTHDERETRDTTAAQAPTPIPTATPTLTTTPIPTDHVQPGKPPIVSNGTPQIDETTVGTTAPAGHVNPSRSTAFGDHAEHSPLNFRMVNGNIPMRPSITEIASAELVSSHGAAPATAQPDVADGTLRVASNTRFDIKVPADVSTYSSDMARAINDARPDVNVRAGNNARTDEPTMANVSPRFDLNARAENNARTNETTLVDGSPRLDVNARADGNARPDETARAKGDPPLDGKAQGSAQAHPADRDLKTDGLNAREPVTNRANALTARRGFLAMDIGRADHSITNNYAVDRSIGSNIDGFSVSTHLINQARSPQRRYILGAEIALAVLIASGGIASIKHDRQPKGECLNETDSAPDERDRAAIEVYEPGSEPKTSQKTIERSKPGNSAGSHVSWTDNNHEEEATEREFSPISPPQSTPLLLRPTILVEANDTLESIAEHQLNDANLGWLIADLNRHNIKESFVDGNRIVELRTRQQLFLPVWRDIEEFYHQPESTQQKTLVTIVEQSQIDRELLSSVLGPVIASSMIQIETKNADSAKPQTTLAQHPETPSEQGDA
jgi:hypothetical protein